MYSNKPTNAELCALDRRQREDSAPRLMATVPQLVSLSIRIDERSMISCPKYVRRIVVKSAPALFILPCGNQNCSDGGHDITDDVLAGLRHQRRTFGGSHSCTGWIGSSRCERTMWFECEADYSLDKKSGRDSGASPTNTEELRWNPPR
jgi:hypothetical protein